MIYAPSLHNAYGGAAFPGLADSMFEIGDASDPQWEEVGVFTSNLPNFRRKFFEIFLFLNEIFFKIALLQFHENNAKLSSYLELYSNFIGLDFSTLFFTNMSSEYSVAFLGSSIPEN